MLVSLDYKVTFSTTGRSLAENVKFQRGFGAIVGPNESGKSMILELVRWCLFGTKALRGSNSDYSELTATLIINVKGRTLTIVRTLRNAHVHEGKKELAIGTKPVNAKIVQILGFGLDVFDIACVATQNNLLSLGDMTPSDRKRLVDSVIGLGAIEDLATNEGKIANEMKRDAATIKNIPAPIEPIKPSDYEPSDQVLDRLNRLEDLNSSYDQLVGWLSHTKKEPVQPIRPANDQSVEVLQLVVDAQTVVRARQQFLIAELEKEVPLPDVDLDALQAQWAALWEFRKARGWLAAHGKTPKWTEAEVLEYRSKLTARCECCGQLLPQEGLPTVQELDLDDFRRKEYEEHAVQRAEYEALTDPGTPELTEPEIQQARIAAAQREQYEAYRKELDQIGEVKDSRPELAEARKFYQDLDRYLQDLEEYERWVGERDRRLAKKKILEEEVWDLRDVQKLYRDCGQYEAVMIQFLKQQKQHTEVLSRADALLAEAEDHSKAREGLTEFRLKVKQHLVPSLNKMASVLIRQMTGGQRQSVQVDEEFNILIDKQPINTLSGSGQAVANLAIRIGLGQVLTNNVFSIFMGDEIDGSMDKERAEHTTNALQTLRQKISQVVLVTHKYPTADYYIDLGKNDKPTE